MRRSEAATASRARLITHLQKLGALEARATTFGASLAQAPDAQFDCTAFPLGDGSLQAVVGVDSSCTWTSPTGDVQTPTAGLLTPPGTGTITTVRLRVGRATGPMQLVVLTVEVNTNDGRVSCCTATYVGPPFTPQPDAITTIHTNLEVHTDGPGEQSSPPLQVGEILGVSVLEDGVPIPAVNETASGLAQNQMPSDDVLYPAYGPGVTALASGTVGYQLDMNADWSPSVGSNARR
jgi:hypothetical protein